MLSGVYIPAEKQCLTIKSDHCKPGYKVGGKKYCRPKVVPFSAALARPPRGSWRLCSSHPSLSKNLRGSVVLFNKNIESHLTFYKKLASLITSLFDIYKKLVSISQFLLYTHIVFCTFCNFLASLFTHLKNVHLDPRF